MPRRHLEHELREPQWTIRIITLVILLAGAAVVFYAFSRSEARRERAVRGIEVADSTAQVVERLGQPPHVCATGSLAHLEGHFPTGWPAAAQSRAIERLRQETAERWVYPLRDTTADPCTVPRNATELGIGHDGRVRWFIPLQGRESLRLPPTYEPGTANDDTP
jgi:hypothetical protein